MLHILAHNQDALRELGQNQRVPDDQIWHVWTVTIPRRSITGSLVWGTVWRRRDDDRWIYKRYTDRY